MDQKRQFIETFLQEAQEFLADIEDALLDLEANADDMECIHRIFRSMHTIKGSSAMFGFDDIADFTHHAESVLEKVRSGEIGVTPELINLIFLARDQIRAMLEAAADDAPADLSARGRIVSRLNDLILNAGNNVLRSVERRADGPKSVIYRIRFRPGPDIFAAGMEPTYLLRELRDLGDCRVTARLREVPPLDAIQPERCYLSWDILLETAHDINHVRDVFIFVEDSSDIAIRPLDDVQLGDLESVGPRIGEILVDRGDITTEHISRALKRRKRMGELLMASGEVSGDNVASALVEQGESCNFRTPDVIKRRISGVQSESVRISSEKLDRLINLVGEMVITQSRLNQVADKSDETELSGPVGEMARLTGEMRDFALEMRMLPVGTLFSRFRRLVRDLSLELGKEIELQVEGSETELDKSILERLHNPLVHLIRNSADHGLRSPEERERSGKPRKGTIRLSAAHRGARVEIAIADDGVGLDTASIRAKAEESGLIAPGDPLTDDEAFALIFAPGFSTAREVTDVSGRGVGMDVVKREIEDMGGTIHLRSEPGNGTTIHLSLPLTMAIIEGLQVRAADRDYVLPVSQVETCAEWRDYNASEANKRRMAWVAGDLIPFIRLAEIFALPREMPAVQKVAVVQAGRHRVGVVVDEIVGNIQAVIKPLDRIYRNAPGISGATILADGTVALILDLSDLIRRAKNHEKEGRSVAA